MTDRDHFAAAALTGLVGECGYHSPEDVAGEAYAMADAMLRERERTNHDAAPAARARTDADRDRTDNAATRPGLGTGDTQEPVAWGVATSSGGVIATSISRIDAVDMQSDYECATEVVPLYRSPTLTATPPLHATHGECSVPPECAQPSAGSQSVAWAAVFDGEVDAEFVWPFPADANAWAAARPGVEIVPLYRHPQQPTLTDEERSAIVWCVEMAATTATECDEELAALRGLLERMK